MHKSTALGLAGLAFAAGTFLGIMRYPDPVTCYEDEISIWTGDAHECTPRDNYDEGLLDAFVDVYGQPPGIAPLRCAVDEVIAFHNGAHQLCYPVADAWHLQEVR